MQIHTFYRHKQLLYKLKERTHGHGKPWGWSQTIDVSGRDVGIANLVRCQPDPITYHVLSGNTNFSMCWLITSLCKQHCKTGSQMLKYRKLNLYGFQRKRMKSGGLPGTSTSMPCSFSGLTDQHLRSKSNLMPSPRHHTFTWEGKMDSKSPWVSKKPGVCCLQHLP